jgi:hypothetical protein
MMQESSSGSFLYEETIEKITQDIDKDYNDIKALLKKING